MNIQLKPSKLIFRRNENTWTKIIQTLEGNVLLQEDNVLFEEDMTEEFFDAWEEMTKKIPVFNIVEVERFI
jgi:hypothetical protein